jgi:hypothetical protein
MYLKNIGHDELWKSALETFFEDFLELFFSEWLDLIDFEKPFEFLDNELSKIIPKSESKNRRADKLVKVFLKDGTEHWFLIHVEVQGQHKETFAERMFYYFYRIKDKYNRPITAFALFTYPRNQYPTAYEYEFMGTKLRYEYRSFSVLELAKKERSPQNIFGYLIEIANAEIRSKDDKIILKDLISIIRKMNENDISIPDFRFLLRFVNGYIKWKNDDFFSKFEKEIDLIIKPANSMGLKELFEIKIREHYEQELATSKHEFEQRIELSEKEKLEIVKEAEAYREKAKYREAKLIAEAEALKAEAERKEAELKAEAERKEAELKAEAERKEAELKAEAERKEAELKAKAERKEAELKAEAERKEAEAEQKIELQKKMIITNMYQNNMDIESICSLLQLDEPYVQGIIDNIKNHLFKK